MRVMEQEKHDEDEANLGKKEVEKKGVDQYQADQEEYCLNFRTSLFKVVTAVKIEDINKLEVHKGADPTVELLCNEQEKDPFGKKHEVEGTMFYHRIKILFPGDMERQMFVLKLIGVQKGDEEDGEQDDDEEDDDDSEDAEPDSSLESVIEGYPYD